MARLSDEQRQVMGQWWALAEAGAYQGYTSTDVISAASDLARQGGESLSFAHARALSTLYGYARRMANASTELESADDATVIDYSHIGVPPWARDEPAMTTTPIWHVSFDFSYIDANGDMRTDIRTSVFEMTMPDTIGALKDSIEADAQALADKYNVQLSDVNLREILAV